MAIGALAKGNSGIARFPVAPWHVTFLARDLCVQSGQRITRCRMVELTDTYGLPIAVVVALQTIRAKSALVLVLVATYAALREPQKCSIQILDLDGRAFIRRNVIRRVTLVARHSGMFAFERIARLLMVESCEIPFH
jgi:hypothetical protein